MVAKQVLVPFVLAAASGATTNDQHSLDRLPSGLPEALVATEEAKLTASDGQASDLFGGSVSLSGDTAVVGATFDDHSGGTQAGSAYVFVSNGSIWTEEAKLIASDAATGDVFGASVSLSGDTAVVGAYGDDIHGTGGGNAGSAYVFVGSGSSWTEQAKLTASDASLYNHFGYSVSVSDDTVLVGAISHDHSGFVEAGSAYVFVRSGTHWIEQAKLTASDAADYDFFGHSVSLSGDTAVVGAIGDDHLPGGEDAGSVYVFVRSGTSWTEQAKLTASDAASDDSFGASVSLSSDTVVVGAHDDDHAGGEEAGSAYVFVRSGASWTEQAKLTASDAEPYDALGNSVSLSGDTAVVGALADNHAGAMFAGSAYVFIRSGASWTEQAKLTASDAAAGDLFGHSVSISGGTVVVGADQDNYEGGGADAGSAYVFRLSPGPPVSYCTAGTSASGCQALLSASGTASATAPSGFALSAATVEGQKDGLFFFGTNGQQANPWGNGTSYQCVIPPVVRTPTMAGVGTIGQCDGSFALDLNALWCPTCPKPAKNPGPGATVQAQLWYRDPLSTSNQTTSLSDAVEFGVEL